MARPAREDREYRRRVCKGKRRYGDQWQARRAADSAEVRSGQRFNAYPCRVCGWYHIGHARGYYAEH